MSWGLPHDASTEGWRLDQALAITHLFVGLLLVIAIGWMLWSVWTRKGRERSEFFRGDDRRAVLLPLGIAAAVFVIVDGHLFYTSTRDSHQVFRNVAGAEARDGRLRLQINARQWAWDARYAGVDGRFGTPDDVYVTTDIRIPVGRPVVVELAAVDVVHSLSIPNLRVQADAIPGRIGRLWFEANETGVFDIACAQYCGVNHYKMAGALHVLAGSDFDGWLARQSYYATKLVDAEKELEQNRDRGPGLFPRFGRDPAIEPRGWGWPWQGSAR